MTDATSTRAAKPLCPARHISHGWPCHRKKGHKGDAPPKVYWQDPDRWGDWHSTLIDGRMNWWPPAEARMP